MENNFSTNHFEGEYTNSTIYSNETLNNSSSKKSPKYSLANEKYCNYLLKKLSTPFPKIENKTKLETKDNSNISSDTKTVDHQNKEEISSSNVVDNNVNPSVPIFCRKCGTKLDSDALFCRKCGTKVR